MSFILEVNNRWKPKISIMVGLLYLTSPYCETLEDLQHDITTNQHSTIFSEENIVGAFEIKENIIVNIYIKFSFLKMNRIMELVN